MISRKWCKIKDSYDICSDGRYPYSKSKIAIFFQNRKKLKSRFCDQIAGRSCAMKNTSDRADRPLYKLAYNRCLVRCSGMGHGCTDDRRQPAVSDPNHVTRR